MRKKIIFLIVIAIAVMTYLSYNYIYKSHRDISSEAAAYTIDANILNNDFINNYDNAQTKYLNKTLVVNGVISEISRSEITLNGSVFCSLLKELENSNLTLKEKITVKGRCIGYDDLLGEVKLDQCSILNRN